MKISTSSRERTRFQQKGIYEKLLCKDCEQHLNHFEKHAKKLFYDEMNHFDTGTPNEIRIVGLDYSKFKLFQLSLLWRASVARHPFFKNVNLGPHEDRIRRMLLQSNPGKPNEYGCVILGLFTEEKVVFDVISVPEKGRIQGHTCYRFLLGGCVWIYVVSNRTKELPKHEYFLQPDGSLLMRFLPLERVPFIMSLIKALQKSGNLE